MSELATKWTEQNSTMVTAFVKNIIDGTFLVSDEFGRVGRASKAASCLIVPEIGDRVLAVHTGDGSFILAVLERHQAGKTPSTLSVDGDMTVLLEDGSIDVSAKRGIRLTTPSDLSVVASNVGFGGEAFVATFQKMELLSSKVTANLADVKLFSKRLRSKVETAMQQFVRRHAAVESADTVTAGTIKQAAKELMMLKSAFAFMKAKKEIKIDSEQIHLG